LLGQQNEKHRGSKKTQPIIFTKLACSQTLII
jgi:hypothetical protein